MATYRFRVRFEEYEDVTRDIEIKSVQTFEDLHFAIHTAIGFDASKPASFYLSDDYWKKGKEITTGEPNDNNVNALSAKKSRLCDFIADPHQKIYYSFDPSNPWTFKIELIKISRDEEAGVTYPRCVKNSGEAPRQYNTASITSNPVPDQFDEEFDDETDDAAEADTLEVEVDDLPEGEEKDEFLSSDEESSGDDFETADEESIDDESPEKDDF